MNAQDRTEPSIDAPVVDGPAAGSSAAGSQIGDGPVFDAPIFDALAERAPLDPLEDVALSDAVPVLPTADDEAPLPPDAAERDAAKRSANLDDGVIGDEDFRFITRGTTDEERAAVIAVLTAVRAEETRQVRSVERREHQPWARSQRVPEGIGDFLAEG